MGVCEKLSQTVDVKACPHKFHDFLKCRMSNLPNIVSDIHGVGVHEGDWDSHGHGSIKIWNYSIDGKPETFKERVEFYDEKLEVKLIGLDGDIFKLYKTCILLIQIIPACPGHCLVVITMTFEKCDPATPDPSKYLDFVVGVIKNIGSHVQ